jgi:lysine 2,3-aminomutase
MDDWLRLLTQSVKNGQELGAYFPGTETSEIDEVVKKYPMRVNPYYLGLIKEKGDSIWKQAIPDAREMADAVCVEDPLSEESQSPVPNLVHRYPDRVLFLVSHQCAMYCRFCTRKRKVGDPAIINKDTITAGLRYIATHPEIRDVIVSGGDPLLLEDEELEDILGRLREIRHVEIIRIGSRVPCTLPQRVTVRLCRILRKFNPLFVNVHFNHPDEVTIESRLACARLADAGIPLNNQAVLLRGVNDHPEVIKLLFRKLLTMRVRPYYMYQADVTKGTDHFRTPVDKGVEVMKALRGHISGLAVPYYVIDAPGGGGKIPLLPRYVLRHSKTEVVMRNYRGELHKYPEILPETQTIETAAKASSQLLIEQFK